MRLYVGQAGFRGDLGHYAKRFEMVEVLADRNKLPRRAKLESWRASVPQTFVWSVVLPPLVASLESSEASEKMIAFAEETAATLRASWWLLKTPATVTPTASSRRRLTALAERLQRDERRVAWEARGVWSPQDLDDVAQSVGLYVARDGTREVIPNASVMYTRVRALGPGAHTGPGAVERLAEQLRNAQEAFVIIEGQGAARARNMLHEELTPGDSQEQSE
jgi:uncharacterized protein YecE (DUF72 family)